MLRFESIIKELITNVYSCDEQLLETHKSLDMIGLDSLNYISLIVEIETYFDILIPEELISIENFYSIFRINNVLENIINECIKSIPVHNYTNGRLLITEYICNEIKSQNTWNKFDTNNINTFQLFNSLSKQNNLASLNTLTRKGFNSYYDFNNYSQNTYYSFCIINSSNSSDVILNCTFSGKVNMWLNNKLIITLDTYSGKTEKVLCKLNCGYNFLVIRQVNPDYNNITNIQILDCNYETNVQNDFSLINCNENLSNCDIKFVCENDSYNNTYKFTCFQTENNYLSYYDIELYDTRFNKIQTIDSTMGKLVEIPVNYNVNSDEELNHMMIKCIFKLQDNSSNYEHNLFVFPTNLKQHANNIIPSVYEFSLTQNKLLGEHIRGLCNEIYRQIEIGNFDRCYWWLQYIKNIINDIQTNKLVDDFIYSEGCHELFIHSDIDDSYTKLLIRIPKNYDRTKKYPAIFALSTSHEGYFGWCVNFNDCLTFDLSGRGYTGGSYIGEASILELLNWCKANYNIDINRMYFVGFSNGGFATWAVAQNYPDLSAAIFPLSGLPNKNQIHNIENISCYQIKSKQDYLFNNYNNSELLKLEKYYEYDIDNMLHIHFNPFLFNSYIYSQLLLNQKQHDTNHIDFTTYRLRHNKCAWIEIQDFEGEFCNIKADITNEHTVIIITHNVNRFTLKIPSQIKNYITCIIDDNVFDFKRISDKITFSKESCWGLVSDNHFPINYRKGTGLADVYLGPTRIVVDTLNTCINNLSSKLSKPLSNGLNPTIQVEYPIIEISSIKSLSGYNYVLINPDVSCKKIFGIDKMTDIIVCENDGYILESQKTTCDYITMQILPNPHNYVNSILLIETNNYELLEKHLLLRKVILPTYFSGKHPYWNCEALIYDGNNYKVVK